jgi:hypothetical protein
MKVDATRMIVVVPPPIKEKLETSKLPMIMEPQGFVNVGVLLKAIALVVPVEKMGDTCKAVVTAELLFVINTCAVVGGAEVPKPAFPLTRRPFEGGAIPA